MAAARARGLATRRHRLDCGLCGKPRLSWALPLAGATAGLASSGPEHGWTSYTWYPCFSAVGAQKKRSVRIVFPRPAQISQADNLVPRRLCGRCFLLLALLLLLAGLVLVQRQRAVVVRVQRLEAVFLLCLLLAFGGADVLFLAQLAVAVLVHRLERFLRGLFLLLLSQHRHAHAGRQHQRQELLHTCTPHTMLENSQGHTPIARIVTRGTYVLCAPVFAFPTFNGLAILSTTPQRRDSGHYPPPGRMRAFAATALPLKTYAEKVQSERRRRSVRPGNSRRQGGQDRRPGARRERWDWQCPLGDCLPRSKVNQRLQVAEFVRIRSVKTAANRPESDDFGYVRLSIRNQFQANQPVLAPQIYQAMRHDGCGPARIVQHRLPVANQLLAQLGIREVDHCDLLEVLWIGFQQPELAVLAQAEEIAVCQQQGRAGHSRLAPDDFAGRPLDAAELGRVVVPAGAAVKVAVDIDRRIPVRLHRLVTAAIVLPQNIGFARAGFEQSGARAVRLADKYFVADDDRHAGVDAFQNWRPPGIVE